MYNSIFTHTLYCELDLEYVVIVTHNTFKFTG